MPVGACSTTGSTLAPKPVRPTIFYMTAVPFWRRKKRGEGGGGEVEEGVFAVKMAGSSLNIGGLFAQEADLEIEEVALCAKICWCERESLLEGL